MALTKIEWTKYTFNPWIGCQKVAQECKFCYAESWAGRYKPDQELWGPNSLRYATSDNYWNQPLQWNKAAAAAGERHFVFCASLADWAEDRPELVPYRARLFDLIRATPHLTWQLLTKRFAHGARLLMDLQERNLLPKNIVLGYTTGTVDSMWEARQVIDIAKYQDRWPNVRLFLSVEPLLESLTGAFNDLLDVIIPDAIVVGGESGSQARPMQLAWARDLRDMCSDARIPFMFKQWGEWVPVGQLQPQDPIATLREGTKNLIVLGEGKFSERAYFKLGKGRTGRLLDGIIHDEMLQP
jgi:protein gp37